MALNEIGYSYILGFRDATKIRRLQEKRCNNRRTFIYSLKSWSKTFILEVL